MKSKSILELNADEARSFFLKNESYCTIELLDYINFQSLIDALSSEIGNKELSDICQNFKEDKPSNYENVNHTLLANKDGRFSWRPLKLIHPALYVLLVHKITIKNNWSLIINRFSSVLEALDNRIECKSLPRISTTSESDKAAQVNTWWQEIEQASLRIAIEFSYIIHADISDCYGSIYTHSILWAIYGKEEAKKKENRKNNSLIGNVIDSILRDMSYGQTNGIPQGSVLMDFLAEIVLVYIDSNIDAKLQNTDYKIIRYRDDYRIFTQSETDGLKVLKVLTEVLADLGMNLNARKTVASDNLIRESVKPDKWFLLDNIPRHYSLQKQLMFIHKVSGLHPNSGSLKKELLKFYKKLHKRESINEDIFVLIAIASDIAYRNPSTYIHVSAILSKFISYLNDDDKTNIFRKIIKRFDSIPNTGLLDIWLQRIAIPNKLSIEDQLKEPLCKIVSGDNSVRNDVWNSDWLNAQCKHIVLKTEIIDTDNLCNKNPIIDVDEISLFEERY
ncbi:MAG: RNA-directed DNA polymerase [Methylococcaceae bacterium]